MHVRLERSDGILEGIPSSDLPNISTQITVGPWEWVQLTYGELRVAPEGDVIAYISDGAWFIVSPEDPRGGRHIAAGLVHQHATMTDLIHPFSDIVVYGAS